MRPPMQSTALQQHEGYHQTHVNANATHPAQLSQPRSPIGLDSPQQQLQQQQPLQLTHKSNKLAPLELLVEKLSYSNSTGTYQQSPVSDNDGNNRRQLLDLSDPVRTEASPRAPPAPPPPPPLPQRSSISSQISRSSSTDDGLSAARANIFDDAAENFIIKYPADSSQQLLPLSETVPLLTHIEATVVDKQRSIRLSKNSASLIFTRKELSSIPITRRQHQSFYTAGERPRRQTKHLPPGRTQQQRRSLQLNYIHCNKSNNNLVTTATCAAAATGTSGSSVAVNSAHNCSSNGKVAALHKHHTGGGAGLSLSSPSSAGTSARKQHSYSWYAPVYSALEEELEQDSRDSSPLHNLANTKQQISASRQHSSRVHSVTHVAPPPHDASETVALLETRKKLNIAAEIVREPDAGARKAVPHSLSLSLSGSVGGGIGAVGGGGGGGGGSGTAVHDVEGSLGGPLPRRRRLENFLKSLVGLKSSSGRDGSSAPHNTPNQRPASPEIRITRTPSEQDVVLRDPAGRKGSGQGQLTNGSRNGSTSSLNVVHQKLWHMVRREGSASSLHQEKSQSIVQYTGLRKCETVLALTRQSHSHSHSHSLCPAPSDGSMTAALTGSGIFSASGVEQIRPLNRLRNSVTSINGATCSRCSSILSLAASGSRYSLTNGFVSSSAQSLPPRRPSVSFSTTVDVIDAPVFEEELQEPEHINVNAQIRSSGSSGARKSSAGAQSTSSNSPSSNVTTATLHSNNAMDVANGAELGAFGTTHAYPLTVTSLLSMATANQAAQSCCVRDGITLKRREMIASTDVTPSAGTPSSPHLQPFTCKLCLIDVESNDEATTLQMCSCQFCTECMRAYVEFEISEGAYEISCPDAKCAAQGALTLPEIANLTTTNLLKKHHRYRLNREIELDKTRTWCPRAGCETICVVNGVGGGHSAICHMDESPSTSATSPSYTPQLDGAGLSLAVQCPSCKDEFCALCKKAYHPNINCEEFGRRLIADGQDDIGIPFDNELIKCCPMCAVPIEKDEGCAQMMCKRCKHVFCWYCLASLDDDFLLRHYDKGPCKNKLGHSRASVVWHRAQVIGIFAGFGILLLVASPLLLLAAPCIICCKCRGCSGSKIDEVDAELEEEVTALQG